VTLTNFRPSKRPSVKQVKHWDLVFDDYTDRHWRGDAFNGGVEVLRGYPFPDFYKVIYVPSDPSQKKISKLFYGESAHHNVVRFVADLGFQSIYTSNLY
jgi:hypothetical protein